MKATGNNFIFAILAVVLASCGGASGVRETLGLKKKTPDEFMVLTRPSLVVPPDFNLPPPGAFEKHNDSKISDEAKLSLFKNNNANTSISIGEKALLKNAGADMADKNIRVKLAEENNVGSNDEGIIKTIVSPLKSEKAEPVVDADKEEVRLQKNKAEGKSVNDGDSPTKTPESEGLINKIF